MPSGEAGRRRSLGIDPASGKYRPGEEQAALLLERTTGPLLRDPSGQADWLDAAGRSYDAVGPVPPGKFVLRSVTRQIDKHLLKQGLDRVVVDLSARAASERNSVLAFISRLSSAEQTRMIVQP